MIFSSYISASLLALAAVSQAQTLVENPRDVVARDWQNSNVEYNKTLDVRAGPPKVLLKGGNWPDGMEGFCYRALCLMKDADYVSYRDSDNSNKKKRYTQRGSSKMFKNKFMKKGFTSRFSVIHTSPDDFPPRSSIPVDWLSVTMNMTANPPQPILPSSLDQRGSMYGIPLYQQYAQGGEMRAAFDRAGVLPIDWTIGPQANNKFVWDFQPTNPGYWCKAWQMKDYSKCKNPPNNDGPSHHSYVKLGLGGSGSKSYYGLAKQVH